jgi:hypothetical protein
MWKEVIVTSFEPISVNLPGMTEQQNTEPRHPVFGLEFEPVTFEYEAGVVTLDRDVGCDVL